MKLIEGYETWSELELLTGTILGEASGEPWDGKVGVGLTIRTRVQYPRWWGRNWREVCLAAAQFSCWQDHNALRIIRAKNGMTSEWKQCYEIAVQIYLGIIQDTIGKPTHYHAVSITPSWARRFVPLATIGDHRFYRDPTIEVI